MSKRKLTIEQEYIVKEQYETGYQVPELMELYGFKTKKSIYDIIERRGGKVRTFEETQLLKNPERSISFKRLDNPFKAYFVGLMLTDGWIHKSTIGISMTDKDVIEFVCKQFGKDAKLIKKGGNRKPQYRLCTNNERVVNELRRFGITERKSLTLQPPRLKQSEVQYLPYLMRGIIDGDGWIRKDAKEFFICSMSHDFIVWCKKILEKHFKFTGMNLFQGDKGVWYLRTAEHRNMMLLYIHMYYEPFGMSRKYNKLMERFRDYN